MPNVLLCIPLDHTREAERGGGGSDIRATQFLHTVAQACAPERLLQCRCISDRPTRVAFGPSIVKTAPLKSTSGEIITDRSKQMERWAEHYQELYSRETTVTDRAIENTPSLPVMEELDRPPTVEELSKAIDSLANNKALGKDGIPAEIIKAGKKSCLVSHLHELLLQCWEEGNVPQGMRDANIVKL